MKAPMRYTICFIFLDFNLLFYFSSKPFCLYTSVSDDHGIADVKLNITVINGIIQIKRIAIFVAPAVLFSLGNKFSGTGGSYSGSLRNNGTFALRIESQHQRAAAAKIVLITRFMLPHDGIK